MLKTKLELPVGTRLFSLPTKKDGEPLTLDEWEVMGTLHGKTVVVCKSDERAEVHAIYTDLDGNIYNSPGGWKYWRTAQECVADGIAAEHRTVLAWRENLEDAEDTLHQLRELQEGLHAKQAVMAAEEQAPVPAPPKTAYAPWVLSDDGMVRLPELLTRRLGLKPGDAVYFLDITGGGARIVTQKEFASYLGDPSD